MAVDDICYSYNCRNCAADDRRNEFFDAVCHSFSTTATGGYSTKQASVAYWNSPVYRICNSDIYDPFGY